MKGVPKVFNTKEDWLNAYQVVASGKNNKLDRIQLMERLQGLQNSKTMLVPKKSAKPSVPADAPPGTEPSFQPEDFEPVADLQSPFARSGLNDTQITEMIAGLQKGL
jgi:hypothetical protein